jgi:hypothetical protein
MNYMIDADTYTHKKVIVKRKREKGEREQGGTKRDTQNDI